MPRRPRDLAPGIQHAGVSAAGWSSYGTTIGASDTFGFVDAREVLGEFGTTRSTQIRGLRSFVEPD